jgi:hypothetical protein
MRKAHSIKKRPNAVFKYGMVGLTPFQSCREPVPLYFNPTVTNLFGNQGMTDALVFVRFTFSRRKAALLFR